MAKLLDTAREKIRVKQYSYKTEQTYVGWMKRYILFHNKRHPAEIGAVEIEQYRHAGRIRCGTRLRRGCWREDTTFAKFKNYWVTKT